MGSSSTSCPSHKNVHHQRKPFPVECRPRMLLKDFLNENSNSCSSSGFKSFPRQIPLNPSNPPNFIEFDSKPRISNPTNSTPITRKLLRSRSKAASTTISAFQSLINAVKNIPFTTGKPPLFLPRSFSRRMLQSKQSSSRKQSQRQVQITVRVKDIIRWRSFSDEKLPPPPPLEFASSPLHCTTATTTCTTCSSSNSSNGSSWCDSDFTAEFLPPWGENEAQVGKKDLPCVGRASMETTTGTGSYTASGPQVDKVLLSDQDEQHSPVSVFQFGGEDEDSFSNVFDQSLANVERAKEMLMQKINYFEILATVDHVKSGIPLEETPNFDEEDGVEERAMELLDYVKATSSTLDSSFGANMEDQVLLDFFKEEISAQRKRKDDGFNWEMVAKAEAWVSGMHDAPLEWGQEEHKKEACVRDMHKRGGWNKFGDEQEELALEIENAMSEYLVDELLLDLLSSSEKPEILGGLDETYDDFN